MRFFLLWKVKIKNYHRRNGGKRREESYLEVQAPKKDKQVLTEDILQFAKSLQSRICS
jgi:hypothetical protein